jgi:hypothetical protein
MSQTTDLFNELLKLAVKSGASDIVIKSEKPAYVRVSGRLRVIVAMPPEMVSISSWLMRSPANRFQVNYFQYSLKIICRLIGDHFGRSANRLIGARSKAQPVRRFGRTSTGRLRPTARLPKAGWHFDELAEMGCNAGGPLCK